MWRGTGRRGGFYVVRHPGNIVPKIVPGCDLPDELHQSLRYVESITSDLPRK